MAFNQRGGLAPDVRRQLAARPVQQGQGLRFRHGRDMHGPAVRPGGNQLTVARRDEQRMGRGHLGQERQGFVGPEVVEDDQVAAAGLGEMLGDLARQAQRILLGRLGKAEQTLPGAQHLFLPSIRSERRPQHPVPELPADREVSGQRSGQRRLAGAGHAP